MDKLVCKKCGFGKSRPWITRLIDRLPVQCPQCKSLSWNKEKKSK